MIKVSADGIIHDAVSKRLNEFGSSLSYLPRRRGVSSNSITLAWRYGSIDRSSCNGYPAKVNIVDGCPGRLFYSGDPWIMKCDRFSRDREEV